MRKRVKRFFKNFWTVIRRPEMLVLPGQLAFFFILSVVPILTIIGYGVVSFHLSFDILVEFLSKSFGTDIVNLIMPNTSDISMSFGLIVTIIVGLVFASNGAAAIIVTSNSIYGIEDKGFLRRRIKAFIMTIFMIILFLFILVVPLLGNLIIKWKEYLLWKKHLLVPLFGESIIRIADSINSASKDGVAQVIRILNGPISWFIIFFLVKLLYTMAPDKNIPANKTTYGALFTTVGWVIATAIYSFYINNIADYSLFYGSLANIIILMLWTYLLAFIFTIGLALNNHRETNKE